MADFFIIKMKVDVGNEEEEHVSHYHAKALWEDGTISLILLCGRDAYRLRLEERQMEELGARLKIDVKGWAGEAFKTSSPNHAFSLSKAKRELVWKKIGEENVRGRKHAKIRIGAFQLEEMDFVEGQGAILDAAVEACEAKDARDADRSERLSRLMEDHREARKKLTEFAEGKEKSERELYERFLPILQSKQDKIAQLMRGGGSDRDGQVESYGSDTDVDDDDNSQTPSKQARLDFSSPSQKSADDSQNFLKLS